MGKVQRIKSARKEWKCSKCGCTIKVGDSYYKGEINFGPTIVACKKCGLKHYEVTTSEWTRRVGRLVEDFNNDYGYGEDIIDSLSSEIEDIQSEVQDKLDNMPEGLQEGDTGQLLQSRIDMCEDALSELSNIDIEEVQSEALDDTLKDSLMDPKLLEKLSDYSYDQIMNSDEISDSLKNEIVSEFENRLNDLVSDAISGLEY